MDRHRLRHPYDLCQQARRKQHEYDLQQTWQPVALRSVTQEHGQQAAALQQVAPRHELYQEVAQQLAAPQYEPYQAAAPQPVALRLDGPRSQSSDRPHQAVFG